MRKHKCEEWCICKPIRDVDISSSAIHYLQPATSFVNKNKGCFDQNFAEFRENIDLQNMLLTVNLDSQAVFFLTRKINECFLF